MNQWLAKQRQQRLVIKHRFGKIHCLLRTARTLFATVMMFTLALVVHSESAWAQKELTVYSARQDHLIRPLLERFESQSGAEIKLLTAKADVLLERMQAEGERTPADVLITVDAGRLSRAKKSGLLQAVEDSAIERQLADHLRDDEGHWFALSLRSRIIVYNPDTIHERQLRSYGDLASPVLKGKICIRSSSNIYNQSLVASRIVHWGERATLRWLKGLVGNMARSPKGGDRDQIVAIAHGACDVAVVNDYYWLAMLESDNPTHRSASQAVRVVYPDQKQRGTHVNVSGIGVSQYSQNVDLAKELIRFLLTPESQRFYANINKEMPVIAGIASESSRLYGQKKLDRLKLSELGAKNAQAIRLMERARWK